MIQVIMKNYDTNAEIFRCKAKRFNRPSDLLPILSMQQAENDILGIGSASYLITDIGINQWTVKGNVLDSGTKHNPDSMPDPVVIFSEGKKIKTDLRVQIIAYPKGYVLFTGKTNQSILGTKSPQYITHIGKRNVRTSSLAGCHIFPSLRSIEAYIIKHKKVLQYLVTEYGNQFSVEYANSMFEEEMKACKNADMEYKRMETVQEMLDEINHVQVSEEETPIPEGCSPQDQRMEAVERMKKLHLWERIIDEFEKNNKIYQSETGGILYDPDKTAQKVIKDISEKGYVPYHVVVSNATFGTCYNVLYVSNDTGSWKMERPDRYGILHVYVYNASAQEFSEYGEICVQNSNGGLIRTA